jgi:protein ImuB
MGEAPATRVSGPYIVSGGWWARPVHREYHFAETETGRILWIYFDKTRRSWFLHGEVE